MDIPRPTGNDAGTSQAYTTGQTESLMDEPATTPHPRNTPNLPHTQPSKRHGFDADHARQYTGGAASGGSEFAESMQLGITPVHARGLHGPFL